MSARDRVRKYRQTGGASDLIRVEVLVPSSKRAEIVGDAARLRGEHRERKQRLHEICSKAVERYSIRLFDNVDLGRVQDPMLQARVIANALMERGDARAFVMGRQILAELES